jgi:hypothetical protein
MIEITCPAVALSKRTFLIRSDQLRALRGLALDLALDDYSFSQAEMVRAALAAFLARPVWEQVAALEAYREAETCLGVGQGAQRWQAG